MKHFIWFIFSLNFAFMQMLLKYLMEWQTVQTLIRLLFRSSLIWVCTICLCHFLESLVYKILEIYCSQTILQLYSEISWLT